MLTLLKDVKGEVVINGKKYDSVRNALKSFESDSDKIMITFIRNKSERTTTKGRADTRRVVKKITVRQYMTRPSSDDFTFMKEWNNDIPMPLRTMVGTVERETKGMVYMKLHGDITEEKTLHCLKCGRPITNPVSQYFGLGPECGGHKYVNPFYSKEELEKAVNTYRETVLKNITWEGWVVKSAIISEEIINDG